jgi:hypothetical protein
MIAIENSQANLHPSRNRAIERLRRINLYLKQPQHIDTVWWQLLTEEERECLQARDDLREVVHTLGGAGLWAIAKNLEIQVAIVQLGRHLQWIRDFEFNWLCREFCISERELRSGTDSILWDVETGTLMIDGEVVGRIVQLAQATNQVTVLNAFQRKRWPRRIPDPLPGRRDPERLNQTIRSLNRGFTGIRFHADGTGAGIFFEYPASSSR